MCAARDLLSGASFVSLAGQQLVVAKTTVIRLLYVNIAVYIFRIGPKKAGFSFFTAHISSGGYANYHCGPCGIHEDNLTKSSYHYYNSRD